MMHLGIVGLPNAGKSSLFNALTQASAEIGSYPFTTIDPNVGVVPVPDARLEQVAAAAGSAEVIPTAIEFVDIAGLVRGAHRGEGLGNQFLAHIRELDALMHVIRCFEAETIVHVDGTVDPLRDIETVEIELILADMATIEKRLERLERAAKGGTRDHLEQLATLNKLNEQLNAGVPGRSVELSTAEQEQLTDLHLLTLKPTIYAVNVDEELFRDWARDSGPGDDVEWLGKSSGPGLPALAEYLGETDQDVVVVCARLEAELAELEADLRAEFLADLELAEPALYRLIRTGYRALELITFFTANENQCQARTLRQGMTAVEAAGRVHSDMERGFIRAEVIPAEQLIEAGSFAAAREAGLIRIEGRDYVVADGDVLYIRFNR